MTPKSTETKFAVFDLKVETMEKDIKEIKEELKSNHKEIKDLINGLDNKFATKAEHKENVDRINLIMWVGGVIFVAIITAVVSIYIK